MSANDVTLKLRAVLDTTEVKQKIEELKRYQTSSTSNGGSSSQVNGVSGGNFKNGLNDGIVNRLSNSLNNLNRSIERLYQIVQRTSIGSAPKGTSSIEHSSRGGYLPGIVNGNSQTVGKFTEKAVENELRYWVGKTIKNKNNTAWINQLTPGYSGIFGGFKGSPAQQEKFEELFGGMRPSEIFSKKYRKDSGIDNWLKGNNKNNNFLRGARFLMGAQAFGQVGQSLQDNGYTITGGAVNALTEGTMAGAMGAMALGGPAGIALGAGTALVSFTETLKKSAEQAHKSLMEFCKSVDNSKMAMRNFISNTRFSDFSDSLRKMSYSDLRSTFGDKESALRRAKDERTIYSRQVEQERYEASQRYLERLNNGENRATVEAEYANELQRITNKFNGLEKNVQNAQREFDAVSNALGNYRKVLEDNASRIKQARRFDEQINQFNSDRNLNILMKNNDVNALEVSKNGIELQMKTARDNMKSVLKSGGLDKYEEQTGRLREELLKATTQNEIESIEKIIKHREEVSQKYKESAQELMKLTSKMDGLENSIEQIKKVADNLREQAGNIVKGIGQNAERYQVNDELFNIKYDENGFERRTSPMQQFKQASALLDDYRRKRTNALTTAKTIAIDAQNEDFTNEQRESLLKMSNDLVNRANGYSGNISQIESFIQGLDKTKERPDMSNVTSLGQYGFNMGEKNDNFNRLERYYQTMEDLSRDIRNKLQEGVKMEASYK